MPFLYKPTPTGSLFHNCDDFIKLITGPFGSGKSTVVAYDILYYSLLQPPGPDGVRRTRVGVVRGSYPSLTSTTRNTLLEVLPEGPRNGITQGNAPLMGRFRYPHPDGTIVDLELVLISMVTGEDAPKIRSANWSFAWINEATEVDADVLTAVMSRIGRYPSAQNGGCNYAGILMDFNQPPQGHWLTGVLENPVLVLNDTDPDPIPIAVFRQPPAAFKLVQESGEIEYKVNPLAENLENLSGGERYYKVQIADHLRRGQQDMVDSLFCMLDVPVRDGKAVFPQFNPEMHVAKAPIEPMPYTLTVIGMDTSGIHPAATFWQEHQGKWCCLDELIGMEMGLEAFMEEGLIPLARNKYPHCDFLVSCDPANARDAYTGLAPTTHLRRAGFKIHLPQSNEPKVRIRAVDILLNKQVGGILISPTCKALIRAMNGAYHYARRRLMGSVEGTYSNKPEKNEASHIADSAQYAAMFITQGERSSQDEPKPEITRKLQFNRHLRRSIMVG